MTINTFKRKWNNKAVEDWHTVMSDSANQFVIDFKKLLEDQLEPNGIQVIEFVPNHYDCYGFVEKDDKYIYISYNIPRGGYSIDFTARDPEFGVLYRTAKSTRDFRGGSNHFSSLLDICKSLIEMFDNYGRYAN